MARIVDHLESTPDPRNPGHALADNTIVLFTSNNGGLRKFADNGPLRGQKGAAREGGIRVPLVAWSGNPDLVDGGTVNHTPTFAIDYHPTLAALAGVTAPAVDGRDLSGLFADHERDLDRDALYWHLPGYLVEGGRDQHPGVGGPVRPLEARLLLRGPGLRPLRPLPRPRRDNRPRRCQAGAGQGAGAEAAALAGRLDAPLATLREGDSPIRTRFTGTSYADGKITRHRNDVITVGPGDEVPVLVPR